MKLKELKLGKSWQKILEPEFNKPYIAELEKFLISELNNKVIYPSENEIFNALNLTPFEDVRVVILGQDPYHGPGQAHGLSFSVKPGIPIPPSLKNIYKELARDVGFKPVDHGSLDEWGNQGVLLLNSTLTVEKSHAGSHQKKGWEIFTDRIIEKISEKSSPVVFLLWGSFAQKKGSLINKEKNLVLEAPHPSPLSAYRGFFDCGHFSRSNEYLVENGFREINWQLPEKFLPV